MRAVLLNGKICEICGSTKTWNIDHDHVSGVIRGVLCSSCNIGLAKFQDNPDLLVKAARYLNQRTPSRSVVVPFVQREGAA